MAIFPSMTITNIGQLLYNKVQAGAALNFTKMKLGAGSLSTGQDPQTLTALISSKFDVAISSISQNTQLKVAVITGSRNNDGIDTGTYICELGLYAQDPDAGEILYAYANAGDQGDYFAPASRGAFTWSYQISAAVGNAANVTATLSPNTFDHAVAISDTSFVSINGTTQKEVNESIDAELTSARVSTLKAKTFTDIRDRFEEIEQDRVSDKAETTTEISILDADVATLQSQIIGAITGSPLPATLASQMTDHARNYVYLGTEEGCTPGNLYYWNGSAFTDSGKQYQSAGIAIDSITPEYTNFVRVFKNMFNKSRVTTGYYRRYTDDAKVVSATYFYSDYIPVVPGDVCIFDNTRDTQICLYDTGRNFKSGITTNGTSFVVPDGVYYLIFSDGISYLDSIQLEKGTTRTTYEPYMLDLKDSFAEKINTEVSDARKAVDDVVYDDAGTAVRTQIADVLEKVNYVGVAFTDGYYKRYTDGAITTNTAQCYSDYRPCKSDTDYNFNLPAHICFWDGSKIFISGTLTHQTDPEYEDGNFHTPENCKYVVVSFLKVNKAIAMLVEGSIELAYKKPGYILKDKCVEVCNLSDYLQSRISAIKGVYVDATGAGNYTTVTEAANNIPAGGNALVMPGTYENETITSFDKKIYLMGLSKQDCELVNVSGDYDTPPIEIGAGYLEKLTIYAKDNGVIVPTGLTSYALHVEGNSLYNDNLTVRNCIIKSDWKQALGMGTRGGCNVSFENCDFIGGKNTRSAIYMHDADVVDYVGDQYITLKNCNILNLESILAEDERWAIILQSQERAGTMVYLTVQNCFFKVNSDTPISVINYYGGTSTNPDDFLGLINWRLTSMSYGNNLSEFNA